MKNKLFPFLYYLHRKNPSIYAWIATLCAMRENRPLVNIELSSESMGATPKTDLRLALSRLRSREIIKMIKNLGPKYLTNVLPHFMFSHHNEPTFGLGLAAYPGTKPDCRIKLYNYYHLCRRKIQPEQHVTDIAKRIGLSASSLEKDLSRFKRIHMSSVDFYNSRRRHMKVYYGPFPIRDLVLKYRDLWNQEQHHFYRRLSLDHMVPGEFLFCIRYMSSMKKSVRTDFRLDVRLGIRKYLAYFDASGSATKLYNELKEIGIPKLTFLCIDIDQRPRTQFYFLYPCCALRPRRNFPTHQPG